MDDKLKLLSQKKDQLNALRPLPKKLEQNLEDWFRIELTYSSNAIAGNSLSRSETAELIGMQSNAAMISTAQKKPIISHPVDKKNPAKSILKIGELAKETGETVHTLRFWTKEGLLKVDAYTSGGYQLYNPAMIERVKEIRRLQDEKRLTIKEIKNLLMEK